MGGLGQEYVSFCFVFPARKILREASPAEWRASNAEVAAAIPFSVKLLFLTAAAAE